MSRIIIRAEGVSLVNVIDLMDAYGNMAYGFDNEDQLIIEKTKGNFAQIGEVSFIQVAYGERDNTYLSEEDIAKGVIGFMMCQAQYFPINDLNSAANAFIERLMSATPSNATKAGYSLEYIKTIAEKKLTFASHYDYLNCMLDEFWAKVFGKSATDVWCGGIVSAHGDKCYQYKDEWEKAGIEFHHGALIYLLTYTSEFGDTPKHKSSEWVIQNYNKYKPYIDCCEKKILKEKYGVGK